MTADIHPIEPEPTFHGSAVRKAGPRRRRPDEDHREFRPEIETDEDAEVVPTPPPLRRADRVVSPPTEEDGGTHVNVLG